MHAYMHAYTQTYIHSNVCVCVCVCVCLYAGEHVYQSVDVIVLLFTTLQRQNGP